MKKHILLLFFLFTTVAWAKQPNVVLILSDDQSYTDYGFGWGILIWDPAPRQTGLRDSFGHLFRRG